MFINNNIFPLIGTTISLSAIIFKMGQQSQQLDTITFKVHAQEKKEEYYNSKMCEIHNDVTLLKNDIKYIKSHIQNIENYIKR
jgi:peptidoglycan hydrolase CwlO-like protein